MCNRVDIDRSGTLTLSSCLNWQEIADGVRSRREEENEAKQKERNGQIDLTLVK